MTFIVGTLIKITGYKQLLIAIDEQTFNILNRMKINSWKWVTDEGEDKHYVAVNLDPYDKQIVAEKFEPLVKQKVTIKGQVKHFTPKPTEENPNPSKKYTFELQTIRIQKPSAEEIEFNRIADNAAATAISPATELNALEKQVDELLNL